MNPKFKKKYELLPEDVRRAIDSTEVPLKLQEIGKKYGLQIDKIGLLEEVVAGVMLGSIHPNELVDRIEDRLAIETETAIGLVTDINLQIFISIRESLMKMHEEGEDRDVVHETSPQPEPPVAKEDILAEIENPTPAIHPITPYDQTRPGPASPREMVSQKPDPVAKQFIADKLTETVNMPSQKIEISKPATPPKPRTYAADPYREPIN